MSPRETRGTRAIAETLKHDLHLSLIFGYLLWAVLQCFYSELDEKNQFCIREGFTKKNCSFFDVLPNSSDTK